MEGIGIGPGGPPVPPPATFAVVPYPALRQSPSVSDFGQHYTFVSSSPNDPNALKEEKSKSDILDVEKPVDKKVWLLESDSVVTQIPEYKPPQYNFSQWSQHISLKIGSPENKPFKYLAFWLRT